MQETTSVPENVKQVIDKFLSDEPIRGVVGGERLASSSNNTFETRDPGTGQLIATVSDYSSEDVDAAVKAGERAFGETPWARMSVDERGKLLHGLADAVEEHLDELAYLESLDAGKIYAQACGDVQNLADTLRYFADLAKSVEHRVKLSVPNHDAWQVRHPWGVCGFIFPWNFPLLLLGWGISPALAAGNTVVIKPAEDTSLSTIYFATIAKKCGIPDGVINVVTGRGSTTGAALASHPDLKRMSFTGSPEVGRLVAEQCGRNLVPTKLELGGKGAAVVFDDVDVATVASKLSDAITFHCGQVCCDATRWLVHRPIYDQFVSQCAEMLSNKVIGYQLDDSTQLGPVVSQKQQSRILDYLSKGTAEGAEMVLSGGQAEVAGCEGHYVKPALLAGTLDNVAAQEEIFGPVAYLAVFDDEQEAIAQANNTDYGLANSVWTGSDERANRVAEQLSAGNAWINAHNIFPHGVPYGGIRKSGMGGGVLSIETLMDYYHSMSVVRPL